MKMKITLFLLAHTFCFYQFYAQCDGADFEEKNGIAIMELDAKVAGSWRKETISGASGGSALTYRGTDFFSSPGNSVITYKVKINSAGTYKFIWRNQISIIATDAPPSTEHNDSWLKINASNFFGKKGSSIIYPGGSGKTPIAKGATSGGWFKVYTNSVPWSWSTNTSDNDAHEVFATFNSPGVYDILVSGRSKGHTIDRMVLFKENSFSNAQAQDLSRSVTTCSGSTTPTPTPPPPTTPTTNQSPTVSITTPSAGQNITAGTNVTVGLSANDSDGTIAKHEVFVNNVKVDTDGSTYTPHIISKIQPGSYAIRATVTDNGGKTASSTVNITVSTSGGTTPTPEPPADNTAPVVTFISPSSGQNFNVGDNVTVNLSASDADGTVVKHQIFVNNALVDTDGTSFTPHIIRQIAAGSYVVRATVTDNDGKTASVTTNFTVGNGSNSVPIVQFTSLAQGQQFATGTTIFVELSANDIDGTITKYQVFINNNLVDTDGVTYTPHPFRATEAGNYTIKVVVTDNKGATATAEVDIVVGTTSTLSAKATTTAIAFPNPIETDGNVSIRLPEGSSGEFYYSVANGSGVQVEQGNFNITQSETDIDLQLSNVGRQAPGVYYLTLISRNSEQTIPIIRK